MSVAGDGLTEPNLYFYSPLRGIKMQTNLAGSLLTGTATGQSLFSGEQCSPLPFSSIFLYFLFLFYAV